MRFNISHKVRGIDVAQFERLYFDEAFNEAMCASLGLGRRLVSLTEDGATFSRVVEVTADREIPRAVQKVLGNKAIAYTETLRYSQISHTGTWGTVASVLSDKIDSQGDLAVTPADDGILRQVSGDVTVRLFGLGGLIERFIVADVQESYARAANFTQEYLRSRSS